MKQSITIKVPLHQVEEIVLGYCKQFFLDPTLELKHNIRDFRDSNYRGKIQMQAYSNNKKDVFYVESKIDLSEEDIKELFSTYFKDIGYGIASYDWLYPVEYNEDIKLCFTVYQLNLQAEHENTGPRL